MAPHDMKILAFPAHGGGNPYTDQLYRGIQERGHEVAEFRDPWHARGQAADVVHIHWPEQIFWNTSGRKAALRYGLAFLVTLWRFRRRGVPIVWTVHNLSPHEADRGRALDLIWRVFMYAFSRTADAWISLSEAGIGAAAGAYPALAAKPSFVIQHGHYRESYPNTVTRAAARRRLDIGRDTAVMLFFGGIRPYKNIERLISCFKEIPASRDVRLIIAGSGAFVPAYTREIAKMCGADGRIRLEPRFIQADEVQAYLKAADLLVLPFKDILNSGSALLGLSFGTPVLVPDKGAMRELQRRVGADWVKVFSDELSAAELIDALRNLPDRDSDGPDLTDFEWPVIADKTIEAYRGFAKKS